MSTTTSSLPSLSPEQVKAKTHYVERLLDGPTPDESWPTHSETYVLLQELSKIQEIFQKRQEKLVSEGILGNAHKVKEELHGVAIMLWQAHRRNLELLYGGRVEWERVECMKPLDWRDKNYFDSFIQHNCTEPRRSLLEWAQQGPHVGRFVRNQWRRHPNVWQIINDVATGRLDEATIRAAYGRLFETFPKMSLPPRGLNCSDREKIISNLSANPIFSAWELDRLASALGIGSRERLAN